MSDISNLILFIFCLIGAGIWFKLSIKWNYIFYSTLAFIIAEICFGIGLGKLVKILF